MDSKESTVPSSIPSPYTVSSSIINDSVNHASSKADEGYLSGQEEFKPASDTPLSAGTDGVVEGNYDPSVAVEFTEPQPPPVNGVVNDDSDVGVLDNGVGVQYPSDEGSGGAFDAVGSQEDKVDGGDGKSGVEVGEMKGKVQPANSGIDVSESVSAFVESEKPAVVDTGDVKLASDGDSIADVVATEDSVGNGGVAEKSDIEQVAAVKPDDVGPGDAIVDSIQVDVLGPGVAVVGEVEETLNPEQADSAKPDDGELADTGKDDVIVDSIQAGVLGPGVVVVGEVEKNGGDWAEPADKGISSSGEVVVDSSAADGKDDALDAVPHQPEIQIGENGKDEKSDTGAVIDGVDTDMKYKDSVGGSGSLDVKSDAKEPDREYEPAVVSEAEGNGALEDATVDESTSALTAVPTTAIESQESIKVEDQAGEADGEYEPAVVSEAKGNGALEDESTSALTAVPTTAIKSQESIKVEDQVGEADREYEPAVVSEAKGNGALEDATVDESTSALTAAPTNAIESQKITKVEDQVDEVDGVFEPAAVSDSKENGALEDVAPDESKSAVIAVPTTAIESPEITNVEDQVDEADGEFEPGVDSEAKGNGALEDVEVEESTSAAPVIESPEITKGEDQVDEEDDMSEGDTDGMMFGSSEAAKKFIEELEQGSGEDSYGIVDGSYEQSQGMDGQIVTDSEEGDTDDGDGKEMFDSAALAALLKAATGADSDSGNISFTSRDGSRLFSVERPAGLGSSVRALRPASQPNRSNLFGPLSLSGGGESEDNLSEEERNKLEKLQKIRVKFLRLVQRLGLSPEESVAAQVLYRLALLGGRQGTQTYSLDAAKRMALQLEAEEKENLDFSLNILVLGKSGVGKSATVNSIFGQEKALIDAFETGTASAKEISGFVDGVKLRVVDTPGLKSSAMEQPFNRHVLSSVKKLTSKTSPDVFLYVDRLDTQSRDLNDLPLLKTISGVLGTSIWRSAVVTLTHAASAPPDGPTGNPLSYEMFVTQRSHIVQQSIGHAVGDLRMMNPSLMNPISLVENHPSCRRNREGQKILPNGQSWRPQLLLLCYSMKILSEASSISKPQDPFDHRKLFGFRARSPPLPYMLSSMLQSRPHPKLPSDQGGDNGDSDIDLDDLSASDEEEEDEYDQLPPFKPLKKVQLAKLSKEQRRAYFEEYDYRVKLLQKKQWKEELRRMKEFKKRGKEGLPEEEEDADTGAAAPVAVPLPDMALPPSFDGDNPAYRYRFLEPTSHFLARPVLDSHGWDHDCGYDGVNLEHSLAIASRFPVSYTIQITKDKKDLSFSLDSSVGVKHGDNLSSMAGFDIQSMGKQLAYIVRGETKAKKWKKNKVAGGASVTFLGENMVPGVKVEDQITLGKQYSLVGSAGAVRSQQDTAYGANFELQRREVDYPIGQIQSTLSMSIIKWRGDLALGFNCLTQFSAGRNSKVSIRAGLNNKLSGQVTVRTSSSEHLSLAMAAVLPTVMSIYKKLTAGSADKYSIY